MSIKNCYLCKVSHLNWDGIKSSSFSLFIDGQFFPVKNNSSIILIAALTYNLSISRLKQQLSNMDWSELPRGNPVLLEAVQVNSLIFLILRKYSSARNPTIERNTRFLSLLRLFRVVVRCFKHCEKACKRCNNCWQDMVLYMNNFRIY